MRKWKIVVLAALLMLPQGSVFADGAESEQEQTVTVSGLYSVPAEGDMAGWMILKGHPYENRAEIYYKLSGSMVMSQVKDIRNVDLNELIYWTDDDGNELATTRGDLYTMFGALSQYSSDWFVEKFGDVYLDYFEVSSSDATQQVDKYLKESGQLQSEESQATLKPDTKVITGEELEALLKKQDLPAPGYSEEQGGIVFNAFDNKGNYRGKYDDQSDGFYVSYLHNHSLPEPPKLSDKWMSVEILSKIYKNYWYIRDNRLRIDDQKEYSVDLPLPDNWKRTNVFEGKLGSIRFKKYFNNPNELYNLTWVSEADLKEKADISVFMTDGKNLNERAFYGPLDRSKGAMPALHKFITPQNWTEDSGIVNLNGVHAKIEGRYIYYFVEDLIKLNIVVPPKESSQFTFYLNVDDLTAAGYLK